MTNSGKDSIESVRQTKLDGTDTIRQSKNTPSPDETKSGDKKTESTTKNKQ